MWKNGTKSVLYRLRTIPKLDRKFLYLELISAIVVYHHLLFVKLTIGWCAAMTIACSVYKSRKDNTFRGSLADVLRYFLLSISALQIYWLERQTCASNCIIGRKYLEQLLHISKVSFFWDQSQDISSSGFPLKKPASDLLTYLISEKTDFYLNTNSWISSMQVSY